MASGEWREKAKAQTKGKAKSVEARSSGRVHRSPNSGLRLRKKRCAQDDNEKPRLRESPALAGRRGRGKQHPYEGKCRFLVATDAPRNDNGKKQQTPFAQGRDGFRMTAKSVEARSSGRVHRSPNSGLRLRRKRSAQDDHEKPRLGESPALAGRRGRSKQRPYEGNAKNRGAIPAG